MLSHPFSLSAAATYASSPSTVDPYVAGALTPDCIQGGLNALNTLRYIAGVNHDVTNNASYQAYAQAAALVSAANGSLSHYPSRPSGMDDVLFDTGYTGASRSNIAYGCVSPAAAMLQYFDDLGSDNAGVVGHRRWLISPRLGQVGIGHVDLFNATYVIGNSDGSTTTDVAWPARVMPTTFFDAGAQWSFTTDASLGSDVCIEVTRRRDGWVWDLSSSEFTVSTTSYGYVSNPCYIWSLEGVGSYLDGDVFDVTISGSSASKSYTVEFFDLVPIENVEVYQDFFSSSKAQVEDGEVVTLTEGSSSQTMGFIPAFSAGTYPQDESLQSIADRARKAITISYVSSDEGVVTVEPKGEHNWYYIIDGSKVRLDWVTDVTPVGCGTATITATLSNGLTYALDVVVSKKSIDPTVDQNATIELSDATLTYNGSAQHPAISIRYGSNDLTEGTDYTVSYEDDVNAGTGRAMITGIGEYEGSHTVEYTIDPQSLSAATVGGISEQAYTGKAVTPVLTVQVGQTTLKNGTDYTLSYKNNVNVGPPRSP